MNAFTSTVLIVIADAVIAFGMTLACDGNERDFKLNFIGVLLAAVLFEVMK